MSSEAYCEREFSFCSAQYSAAPVHRAMPEPGHEKERSVVVSYSLISNCHLCNAEEDCLDATILNGAIQTIHRTDRWKNGKIIGPRVHRGSGLIMLDCANFVERTKAETPAADVAEVAEEAACADVAEEAKEGRSEN